MSSPSIVAVLGSYARPATLEPQVRSLLAQTHPPSEIWCWSNSSGKAMDYDFALSVGVKIVRPLGLGFGYYARSAPAQLAWHHPYVCIMDDDVLPGRRWLEGCIRILETEGPRILSAAGFTIGDPLVLNDRIWHGWGQGGNDAAVEVDVGGHNWVLPSYAIRPMFYEAPIIPHSDDIHMAAMAKRVMGLRSFVAPQPRGDLSLWGTDPEFGRKWGEDENAGGKINPTWVEDRARLIHSHVGRGWKLVGHTR